MFAKRLRRNTNVKPRATKLVLKVAMNYNPTNSVFKVTAIFVAIGEL